MFILVDDLRSTELKYFLVHPITKQPFEQILDEAPHPD